MTPIRITLTLLVLLALGGGATIAAGNGGHGGYEVWTVDQSNSAGKASGGTLYVYNGRRLARTGGATVPERVDLGGAAEELCVKQTGTCGSRTAWATASS